MASVGYISMKGLYAINTLLVCVCVCVSKPCSAPHSSLNSKETWNASACVHVNVRVCVWMHRILVCVCVCVSVELSSVTHSVRLPVVLCTIAHP